MTANMRQSQILIELIQVELICISSRFGQKTLFLGMLSESEGPAERETENESKHPEDACTIDTESGSFLKALFPSRAFSKTTGWHGHGSENSLLQCG